ncbi:MAG: GTP pyrophosphokinase family protein [Clostridia bacterium]|nr:GTP pyrophosphokinase family protein [Clostridia bacterium]
MILEKTSRFNIKNLRDLTAEQNRGDYTAAEVLGLIANFLELSPLYRGAMKEVATKLEVLDEEFSMLREYNPIHHIECRMKTAESIAEKMVRKNIPLSLQSLRENIRDIAGLRVVCNYTSDIYTLSEMLLSQDDITLLRRTDYIENPKPSGYRSLHLVVSVPVFLSAHTEAVPVEIQLRTIAMDMWASLEHSLRYKARDAVSDDLQARLQHCAGLASLLDSEMQAILRDTER